MNDPKRSVRLVLGYMLRLGIGLGLLGLVLWTNREQIRQVLERRPDFALFGIGFGLYFLGVLMSFVRWHILVRALGVPLELGMSIRLGFVGLLYNIVIPGAVGGDFVKAAYLVRMLKSQRAQAAASVGIDRVVGLLGLFLLAVGAGAFGWTTMEPRVRRLVGFAVLLTAVLVVALAVAFTPALYRPLASRLGRWPRISGFFHELTLMGAAYRRRLGVVVGTVAMAAATHALNIVAFMLVGRAMFPEVPGLAQHFLIVPLVLFSTAIPLPFGALGVAENVSLMLFKLTGYAGGALAMMAFHVCQYAGSLIALVVYLTNLNRVRTLAETDEDVLHPLAEPAEPLVSHLPEAVPAPDR